MVPWISAVKEKEKWKCMPSSVLSILTVSWIQETKASSHCLSEVLKASAVTTSSFLLTNYVMVSHTWCGKKGQKSGLLHGINEIRVLDKGEEGLEDSGAA